MAKTSPTSRTLEECRRLGLVAEVVEKWIPSRGKDEDGAPHRGGVRKDLFSFCDIVALDTEQRMVVFIQATTLSNASNRRRKLLNECHENVRYALSCGVRVELWSWRKLKTPVNRRWWQVRRERVTEKMELEDV